MHYPDSGDGEGQTDRKEEKNRGGEMEGERGSDATERAPLKAKEGSATDLSAGRLVGL